MYASSTNNLTTLAGRALLAAIFILSGYGKLMGYMDAAAYAKTTGYMESAGVPGALFPLVIAAELGGGLLILIGFQTRLIALFMALFTLAAGVLFHYKPADSMQMVHFMKNLAITGGFLMLAAHGAGAWSLDGRKDVESEQWPDQRSMRA